MILVLAKTIYSADTWSSKSKNILIQIANT